MCSINTAMKQRLDELEAFLEEQQEPVTDYDEGLVRRLIERITVYDDRLVFEFKSGLETEVQMYTAITQTLLRERLFYVCRVEIRSRLCYTYPVIG